MYWHKMEIAIYKDTKAVIDEIGAFYKCTVYAPNLIATTTANTLTEARFSCEEAMRKYCSEFLTEEEESNED